MAKFLLIHGAAHGAWCWRDVIPALEARGHGARAIDLPSHGDDPTPYDQVTLDDYAQAILRAIDTPVTLVGHSMGGYPITLAAALAPHLIRRLIYVCAYVPASGLSLAERRMQAPSQPLLPHIRMTEDRKGWTVARADLEALFYHDCPPGTVDYAAPRLTTQATAPTAVPVDASGAAGIPRAYIRCGDDRTIPPEFQVTMTADWPAATVATLPCAHSPFFACPDLLAETLIHFAKD